MSWSMAQRRPAANCSALPLRSRLKTRTLYSSASGATAWMMPAQAVPWPNRSRGWSSGATRTWLRVRRSFSTITPPRTMPPTAGWSASMPLSTTATRAPRPVLPPQAHSRSMAASGPRLVSSRRASGMKAADQAGRNGSVASVLPLAGAASVCAGWLVTLGLVEARLGAGVLAKGCQDLQAGLALGRAVAADGIEQRRQLVQIGRLRPAQRLAQRRWLPLQAAFQELLQALNYARADPLVVLRLVDGQRRLVGKDSQQLHILQAKGGGADLVQHLHYSDHLPADHQRRGQDGARHIAGALGEILLEARVLLDVGDGDRLAGHGHITGQAVIHRDAPAHHLVAPHTGSNFKFERVLLFGHQRD